MQIEVSKNLHQGGPKIILHLISENSTLVLRIHFEQKKDGVEDTAIASLPFSTRKHYTLSAGATVSSCSVSLHHR